MNVLAAEVPPPGVGLNTVTCAVPAIATSPAGIAARNWVLLTKVVGRLVPFQRTTEPLTKPLPVAVSVKAPLPARTLAGEIEVSVGRDWVAEGRAE